MTVIFCSGKLPAVTEKERISHVEKFFRKTTHKVQESLANAR